MIQQIGQSLECRWYYEHQVKAHKRHLKEISHRSRSTFRSSEQAKIVKTRKLSLELDKQTKIERENFLLFLKINSIRERKIVPKGFQGPKSLNISVRKQEAEKIFNENFVYVKRFMDMPSFVSAQKHAKEFTKHQLYKQNISKANLHQRLVKLSSFVNKPGVLPPLGSLSEEYAGKLRSENQSKLTDIEDRDEGCVRLQRKSSELNLRGLEEKEKKEEKEEDRVERLEMYDSVILDDERESTPMLASNEGVEEPKSNEEESKGLE